MVAQLRGGTLEHRDFVWVVSHDQSLDLFQIALPDVAVWLGWTTRDYNQASVTNPAEVERRLRETP